jgi:hypothetical protein
VWKTLEHHAVTFPPAYVPHGVKLLYDSKPVDLTPEEEEVRLPQPAPRITPLSAPSGPRPTRVCLCAQVATFFAVMKDTDYATKKVFVQNFWTGFRKVLKGENKQLITEFSKCDFTNIYNWNAEEREKKKLLTNEARVRAARAFWAAPDPSRRRRRRRRRSARRRSSSTRQLSWTAAWRRCALRRVRLVVASHARCVVRRLATSELSPRACSAAEASTPRWA